MENSEDDLTSLEDDSGSLPGVSRARKRKRPNTLGEEGRANLNSYRNMDVDGENCHGSLTSELTPKRKAQNRASQRAFRERRDQRLEDLQNQVKKLMQSLEAQKRENALCRANIYFLRGALYEYRRGVQFGCISRTVPNHLGLLQTTAGTVQSYGKTCEPFDAAVSSIAYACSTEDETFSPAFKSTNESLEWDTNECRRYETIGSMQANTHSCEYNGFREIFDDVLLEGRYDEARDECFSSHQSLLDGKKLAYNPSSILRHEKDVSVSCLFGPSALPAQCGIGGRDHSDLPALTDSRMTTNLEDDMETTSAFAGLDANPMDTYRTPVSVDSNFCPHAKSESP